MRILLPLLTLGALLPTLLVSCSDDTASQSAPVTSPTTSSTTTSTAPLPGPPEWNRAVTPPADDEARQKRASCAYAAGALPGETLGDKTPTDGAQIPIEHFVLVMMENRSFDHYFQKLRESGVADVDVAPDTFSNKNGLGKDEPIRPMPNFCVADVAHGWKPVHAQLADGQMSGFVTSNEGDGQDGARAMGYLTEQTAPMGYWMAKTFSVSDRHFCSLLGPTWPNRMYFYAASSFGLTSNTIAGGDETNIFEHLSKREVDWRVYKTGTPGSAMFINTFLNHRDNFVDIKQFYDDAAAGTLPAVSYLDPQLVGNEARQSSQHPPANHEYGEQFFFDVVKAVTSSPLWSKTALIITYDEHGGFYDHVVPPKACPPDDKAPSEGAELGNFDQLGIRVPLLVVSPFAKKGYVSHAVTDHTSVLRLLELKYRMPALTNRDANAEALLDVFDFANPPFATPPALPSRPEIDAAQDAACIEAFP